MSSRKELLYNHIFIISLIVLVVNDHLLKDLYHNWLTGKISDFAGLVVLPIFIAFLLPKLAKWSCYISALWFIFWKTELSNGLIDFLNQNGLFAISRVVDYSDFIALIILPVPWLIIRNHQFGKIQLLGDFKLTVVTLTTFLVLTATSIRSISYLEPQGTVFIGEKYRLKVPKDTVLARIQQLGYSWKYENDLYKINNIVVSETNNSYHIGTEQDTIKELSFSFIDFPDQSTKKQERLGAQYLYLREVKFSDTNTITDWRLMKRYSKLYNKVSEELFIKKSTKK